MVSGGGKRPKGCLYPFCSLFSVKRSLMATAYSDILNCEHWTLWNSLGNVLFQFQQNKNVKGLQLFFSICSHFHCSQIHRYDIHLDELQLENYTAKLIAPGSKLLFMFPRPFPFKQTGFFVRLILVMIGVTAALCTIWVWARRPLCIKSMMQIRCQMSTICSPVHWILYTERRLWCIYESVFV